MTELAVIADDLTGACDVASSFASAAMPVRVLVDPDDAGAATDTLAVRNTQSRGVAATVAAERVRRALATAPAPIVMKKIDTALRGHLGAELDATLDTLAARAAFVIAAIPAAGRVTRDGRQWFGGRLLATTEFASDPEGAGAESAIAAVIARESTRLTTVVGLDEVRGRALTSALRARIATGARYVVIDAESDVDIAVVTAALLALPRPLCIAGSIAAASALAASVAGGAPPGAGESERAYRPSGADRDHAVGETPPPALVVCGSLHSTARAQIDALVAGGALVLPMAGTPTLVRDATRAFASGRTVVLAAPRAPATPGAEALRATEAALADATYAIVNAAPPRTLAIVGGETSFAVLRRLGATRLDVRGRFVPLVAVSTITSGIAAGVTLVTKGGSGGNADALVDLLGRSTVAAAPSGLAAMS